MRVHTPGGAPITCGGDRVVRRRCGQLLRYVVLMLVGAVAGCSGGRSQTDAKAVNGQSNSTGGQGSAHVVYRPEVKAVDASVVRSALRGVSTNGLALVFDASATGIGRLRFVSCGFAVFRCDSDGRLREETVVQAESPPSRC